MPYIPSKDRDRAAVMPGTPGELNYAITDLCVDYLAGTEKRYADRAEVIGALECAKLEFYRRALAEYEDAAIAKNGDVCP